MALWQNTKGLFCALFFIFSTSLGHSQSAFSKYFDLDTTFDEASTAIEISDGGIISYGTSLPSGFGSSYLNIMKHSCNGDTIWSKKYDASNINYVANISRKVNENPDKTLTFSGVTTDSSGTIMHSNFFLMQTDSAGNIQWTKQYGTNFDEDLGGHLKTLDGGYIMGGHSDSLGNGTYRAPYVVKTDSLGTIEWEYHYLISADTRIRAIEPSPLGGYILSGVTLGLNGSGSYDFYLLKISESGVFEWHNSYGGTGDQGAWGITSTLSNTYILAGVDETSGSTGCLICVDSMGNFLWERNYGSTQDTHGLINVIQLKDSTFICSGSSSFNGDTMGIQGWLLKLDENCDSLWSRFDGNAQVPEYFWGLSLASDGGFIASGRYNRVGVPYSDQWIIKYDSKGCDTCSLDCIACDFIYPKAVAEADTFYLGNTDSVVVQFYDSSQIVHTRRWDFGNGQYKTNKNPVFTFDSAGVYTIILFATYGSCTDMDTIQITVVDTLNCDTVLANFSLQDTISVGDSITLTSTSYADNWTWNFGNGDTSNQQNPTVTFGSVGNFVVSLVVELDTFCWDSVAQNIVILDTITGIETLNSQLSTRNFKVYPNPTDGNITLEYQLQNEDKGTFYLFDVTGKTIVKMKLLSSATSQQILVNNLLVSGVYHYQLKVNDRIVKIDKLIVIEK